MEAQDKTFSFLSSSLLAFKKNAVKTYHVFHDNIKRFGSSIIRSRYFSTFHITALEKTLSLQGQALQPKIYILRSSTSSTILQKTGNSSRVRDLKPPKWALDKATFSLLTGPNHFLHHIDQDFPNSFAHPRPTAAWPWSLVFCGTSNFSIDVDSTPVLHYKDQTPVPIAVLPMLLSCQLSTHHLLVLTFSLNAQGKHLSAHFENNIQYVWIPYFHCRHEHPLERPPKMEYTRYCSFAPAVQNNWLKTQSKVASSSFSSL